MSTLDEVSLIVGFLMPAAIAVITQTHWPSQLKAGVAFLACVVAAFLTTWAKGDVRRTSDVAQVAILVFVAAIGTYHAWWKPSGIAPALETRTDLSSPPHAA